MYERIVLLAGIPDEERLFERIEEYVLTKYAQYVEIVRFSDYTVPHEETLYLLYLSDQNIRELFSRETSASMHVGILPNEQCPYVRQSFGIANDLFEAIDDTLDGEESILVDLLTCNGSLVLGNIVIGDIHGMNRGCKKCDNFFQKIKNSFSDLLNLSFQSYTFTTSKGNVTETAATGILIFEHYVSGLSQNLLKEEYSFCDGRLHALILAPSSIVSYVYYLFLSDFVDKVFSKKLPKSIGWISSSKLEITSPRPIFYTCEDTSLSADALHLEVVPDAVHVHLGRNVKHMTLKKTNEEKETVRVKDLPHAEKVAMLANESIPFFSVASEEDFKELFVALRESSRLSSIFITLIILSTLLATTGLFQNSAPVIIGAMILAPLMSPIVSFAMGVVRGEKELLKESSTTLIVGIVTALMFACLFTYMMPLNLLTDEMKSRLNPNVLDLMVAIISGVAGAYAHAKSEVAKSLAGVAIAVALVPPLSVTGIGIGWWNWEVVYGSFLLFMTNLAGITLSAALTFLIMGFAPVRRATKGIVWTTLFLVVITIPLFFSFYNVIEQNKMLRELKNVERLELESRTIAVRTISVDLSKEVPIIYIKTVSASPLKENELQAIKARIYQLLERPVILDISSEIELR